MNESSSKKKLYLHIGIQKTGSKSIQAGLYLNHTWLEEHGYYVPPDNNNNGNRIKHLMFTKEFQNDITPKKKTRKTLKNISQQALNRVIISSEDFCLLTSEQVQELGKTLLKKMDVVVIVYLRRQDKGLQSTWTQSIKNGAQLPPFEEALPMLYNRRPMYFYHDFLSKWEEVFGKENLRVRLFDEVIRERDIFLDFLMACDLEPSDEVQIPPRQNMTPSAKTMGLVQTISQKLPQAYISEKQYRGSRIYFFSLIQDYAAQAGWDTEKFNLITRELYDIIQEKYAEQNALVARRYFDREQLFVDEFKESPVTPLDIDELSKEDLLGVLAYLAEAFIQYKQNKN